MLTCGSPSDTPQVGARGRRSPGGEKGNRYGHPGPAEARPAAQPAPQTRTRELDPGGTSSSCGRSLLLPHPESSLHGLTLSVDETKAQTQIH